MFEGVTARSVARLELVVRRSNRLRPVAVILVETGVTFAQSETDWVDPGISNDVVKDFERVCLVIRVFI